MERLADDLWRIVFAFAGPAVGARQVAARARTLDEFVEYRLASEPHLRDYYDSVTIARRDAILRPLSLAIPDLRFKLHSDERGFGFQQGARIHWWHARCGHDWWDDVFFSPPPED